MVVTVERSQTQYEQEQYVDTPVNTVLEYVDEPEIEYDQEILILVSAPLLDQKQQSVVGLAIQQEVDSIVDALEEVEEPLSLKITVTVATQESIGKVFAKKYKPLIIHFIGHGSRESDDYALILEDQSGVTSPFNKLDLRDLLNSLDGPPCKLAVLNACHSVGLAEELLNAGVSHVIGINAEDRILDIATRAFSKLFYYALFNERSVSDSYTLGRQAVKANDDLREVFDPKTFQQGVNQVEAIKYQLLPPNGDVHQNQLLEAPVSKGEILYPLWNNTNLSQDDPFFVGRRADIHKLITAFKKNRCLVIHGFGGMGKTALARAVGRWFHERNRWRNGVWEIPLREVKSIAEALSRIQSILGLDQDINSLSSLVQQLQRQRSLIILDDIDNLMASNSNGLRHLIEALMQCPKLALLVTGRRDVPFQVMSTSNNYELRELDTLSAKEAFLRYASNLEEGLVLRSGGQNLDALFNFLDGYPMPIKLVAAFMKEKRCSVDELLTNLEIDPLRPLRPLSEEENRENSLRVTLNLSYNQLPESAKRIFPILGYFPSGISSEMAQSGLIGQNIFDDLVILLKYSMAEPGDMAIDWRVKLPEPARYFAEQKQTESVDDYGSKVLEYFHGFALEAREYFEQDPRSEVAKDLLRVEQGNLKQFLQWGYDNETNTEGQSLSARITCLLISHWAMVMPGKNPLESLEISYTKANEAGDKGAMAQVQKCKGDIQLSGGSPDIAKGSYLNALQLYRECLEESDIPFEWAELNVQIGDIYLKLQDYRESIASYEAAHEVYIRKNSLKLAGNVQVKIGQVFNYQEQVERAKESYTLALEHYRQIEYQPGITRVRSLINALNGSSQSISYQQSYEENINEVLSIKMLYIPSGEFMMGSPQSDKKAFPNEFPQHLVKISSFYMSEFPVTQAQWQAIMENNPSYFKGDRRPVERISWYDAVEFCNRLFQQTGREYRLPSEAEWEYACRANSTTNYSFNDEITTDYANINHSVGETSSVGNYPPNSFGLYDMHGNVWEWCLDHWHDSYERAPENGSVWISPNEYAGRMLRGGSWLVDPRFCRSAARRYSRPAYRNGAIGFRVVSLPQDFS